jgi:hypothetical protein
MKNLKTFEVILQNGKSKYVSASSKKEVFNFFVSEIPKEVKERKDIDQKENFKIS